MYCTRCGSQFSGNFCPVCGAPAAGPDDAPAPGGAAAPGAAAPGAAAPQGSAPPFDAPRGVPPLGWENLLTPGAPTPGPYPGSPFPAAAGGPRRGKIPARLRFFLYGAGSMLGLCLLVFLLLPGRLSALFAPRAAGSTPAAAPTAAPTAAPAPLTPLQAAQAALAEGPYSPKGLTDHLIDLGYSYDEASGAVAQCGADWDAQAVLIAKQILWDAPCCRSQLIAELQRGFTAEVAQRAVDRCGIDWAEVAADYIKAYLRLPLRDGSYEFAYGRDETVRRLVAAGFSEQEANAACNLLWRV